VRIRRLNAVTAVHAEARPLFQVLVVYEDFAAGRRANDTCSFLLAQLGGEFELRSELWKFEVLRDPEHADMAAAEALEADAIIVATHGTKPLPAEVTSWIDRWLPLREGRTGALIALLGGGPNPQQVLPPAYGYLEKVAKAANMDFLPHVLAFTDEDVPSFDIPLPSEVSPARWDELMQRPGPERHWGINE
jgi:hypothetical protein